jgi:hypothetical protein
LCRKIESLTVEDRYSPPEQQKNSKSQNLRRELSDRKREKREVKIKRYQFCWALCIPLLLLAAGTAWAADQPALPEGTPAILASLNPDNVTVLDDQAAMAIRGQDAQYKYVLVRILGLNTFDFGGTQWTWNPLGYRYGAWGGPGWSNGGLTSGLADPADALDTLFMSHDLAYAGSGSKLDADKGLLAGLLNLPSTVSGSDPFWGQIYTATPKGLPSNSDVKVSTLSIFNNRLFFGWHAMPYTEYARRQAVAGVQALILGRSLIGTF